MNFYRFPEDSWKISEYMLSKKLLLTQHILPQLPLEKTFQCSEGVGSKLCIYKKITI